MKYVVWPATLKLNVLRSLCAGLAWAVILTAIGPTEVLWYERLLMGLLAVPFAYFLYIPIGLAAAALSEAGVPVIGILSWMPMLLALPGDPILWLLAQERPELIQTHLKLLNLSPFILILDQDRMVDDVRA
jgi:hypothetical protein